MDQTEHFIEKRPNLFENAETTEEQNTHSQQDPVAELVISADKLIMFQEQRPEDDQSNEALNMAVVVESAPGDQTTTDFITNQINEEIKQEEELEKKFHKSSHQYSKWQTR